MLKRAAAGGAVAAALGLLGPAGPADAVTRTSNLALRVVVAPSPCAVSGTALDFGTYTAGQAGPRDATATISYTSCGPGTLRIELDGGGGGSVSGRQLRSGSSTLSYGLFQDAARTRIFGTGNAAPTVDLTAAGDGRVTVFGRIPGRQDATPGTYTDTVCITLTF
jgi:spore coat protein U-like protein